MNSFLERSPHKFHLNFHLLLQNLRKHPSQVIPSLEGNIKMNLMKSHLTLHHRGLQNPVIKQWKKAAPPQPPTRADKVLRITQNSVHKETTRPYLSYFLNSFCSSRHHHVSFGNLQCWEDS